MRAGMVNAIRVNRNAGSPGPSLAGRASLPSMRMRVGEMQFEVIIPTPDPTETAIRPALAFEVESANLA
jgi:hypothetical protein